MLCVVGRSIPIREGCIADCGIVFLAPNSTNNVVWIGEIMISSIVMPLLIAYFSIGLILWAILGSTHYSFLRGFPVCLIWPSLFLSNWAAGLYIERTDTSPTKHTKQYGIIKPRKAYTNHKCNTPLTWFKKNDTLYRCNKCGKVYRKTTSFNITYGTDIAVWERASTEDWLNAGGKQ
jgi:hypothetical protein